MANEKALQKEAEKMKEEHDKAADEAEKNVKQSGFQKAAGKNEPLVKGYRDKTIVVPVARLQAVIQAMGQDLLQMDINFRKLLADITTTASNNTTTLNKAVGDLTLQIAATQEYLVQEVAWIKGMLLDNVDNMKSMSVEDLKEREEKERKTLVDKINELQEKKAKEIEKQVNEKFNLVEVDRPVQKDDIVNLKYVGKLNGVEFEGGSCDNELIQVGAEQLFKEFEEKLIGAEKNKPGVIHVTFPEDYADEELAGKEADFDVEVLNIRVKQEKSDAKQD